MSILLNNRYRILQTLGAGGFGKTFLAEDTHMPSNRRCVVKQMKRETEDPAVYQIIQQRFGREAAILEMLGNSHDQIPTLYAYFTKPTNSTWFKNGSKAKTCGRCKMKVGSTKVMYASF